MSARRNPGAAVLRRRSPPFRRGAVALGRRQAAVAAARRRRRGLPRARQGAGRGRHSQGGGAAVARRAASGARRAHALHRPRNSGIPRRARRLRLRHAGARHRLDLAVRLRRAEAQISAAGARRQGHRGLRAVGARGRLRRRGAGDDRQGRRCTCPARRRKDLDIERRHRRPLRGVRAHRRGAGRARACRPSWSMPTRRGSRSPSASR